MVIIRSNSSLPDARQLTPDSAEISRFCREPQSGMLDRANADFPSVEVRPRPRTAAEHFAAVIAFGRFRLYPRERLLLEGDKPVKLGCRALDLLIALLGRPGEVVSKRELIARIWAGLTVEEGSLKGQIAKLRRVLRDGQAGDRYISTVIGRGYCFVAPIVRYDGTSQNATSTSSPKPLSYGRALSDNFATDTSRAPLVAIILNAEVARSIMSVLNECVERTQFVSAAASARATAVRA